MQTHTASTLTLRACTLEDEEAVVALWQACALTRPWNDPRADLRQALAAPNATVILGLDASIVAASIMTGFDGHRGWVYYLAVDPARQRHGYGRAMMAAAERWLRERGAPKLQLMLRDDNTDAAGFYARLGFERQTVSVFGKRLDRDHLPL